MSATSSKLMPFSRISLAYIARSPCPREAFNESTRRIFCRYCNHQGQHRLRHGLSCSCHLCFTEGEIQDILVSLNDFPKSILKDSAADKSGLYLGTFSYRVIVFLTLARSCSGVRSGSKQVISFPLTRFTNDSTLILYFYIALQECLPQSQQLFQTYLPSYFYNNDMMVKRYFAPLIIIIG